MEYKCVRARTCVYNINYNIVWCVRYRRNVLSEQIGYRLGQIMREIASEKGFVLVDFNVYEGSWVRCFVSAPPKLSVTQIAKYLKGIGGNALLKEFPEIRKLLWNGQLWNGSYFCETIGSASDRDLLEYVERQKRCQL